MAAVPLLPPFGDEPFTEDDLDRYVDYMAMPEANRAFHALPPAHVGSFAIDNDGRAEWAGRRWRVYAGDLEDAQAQAEVWHDEIDQWLALRTRQLTPRIEIFEQALTQYAINRRAEDESHKSVTLPSVTVKTSKSTKAVVHIGNEETLIDWALRVLPAAERDVVVKTTRKALVLELRKVVKVVTNAARKTTLVKYGDADVVVPGVFTTPPGEVTAKVKPS